MTARAVTTNKNVTFKSATFAARLNDFLVQESSSTHLTGRISAIVSEISKAKTAIEKKAADLGGGTGVPVADVEYGAGVGYFRRYQNGVIYVKPPGGPCWVHGAILTKYLELGAEGGNLAYPISDELATSGGEGRYSHFERGSIFWSYPTGAREIHGAIRDKWASLGWEKSWLGYPISDEQACSEDGRMSQFQNGAIYWWPDTGPIALGPVVLRYKGLYCFGESAGVGSDRPYVTLGVTPVPPALPFAVRTQIYTDVDSGDSRPDELELYRGIPGGMAVGLVLWERDTGDPDKYLALVKKGADLAGKGIGEACGVVLGADAVPICEAIWSEVAPYIVSFANDLLGTGDDEMGRWVRAISAKEMVTTAGRPRQNFWGIEYHFESDLLSDGDASYKAYFSIEPLISPA
jgi:hypothetical protein